MSKEILKSSDYNLRNICPNILMYRNRYVDYIDKVYTFNSEENLSNKYLLIDDLHLRVSSFSSYLVFSIINNFLTNRAVIKKDIEDYYNSQMLNFLKRSKALSFFQLKSLALTWNSIDKTIDFFFKILKEHSEIISQYPVYWSDGEFNYEEKLPLIGLNKDSSLDVYLILQTDFKKYPLYSTSQDYLRIPSVVRVINYFQSQDIKVNLLKILWLDNTDMDSKFKFSVYKKLDSPEILGYVSAFSKEYDSVHNSHFRYNNINQCYVCPYFTSCSSSDLIFNTSRKPFLPQEQTNFSDRII